MPISAALGYSQRFPGPLRALLRCWVLSCLSCWQSLRDCRRRLQKEMGGVITEIVVAVLAFLGTLAGAYASNRKTSALLIYRVDKLEQKVDDLTRETREAQELRERLIALEKEMEALKRCK